MRKMLRFFSLGVLKFLVRPTICFAPGESDSTDCWPHHSTQAHKRLRNTLHVEVRCLEVERGTHTHTHTHTHKCELTVDSAPLRCIT